MVVAHHPLIFQPLKSLREDRWEGALLANIIQTGLVVYCAHTNLDQAPGGTDDLLAEKLELQGAAVLKSTGREDLYKLVVFVPQGYEDAVREAMAAAGAGWIGNYSHCTFQTAGTGTFKPLAGSNPFIGSQGELERVAELRLETVVPRGLLSPVLEAMLQAHPYEEVAYDLYRLEQGKNWALAASDSSAHPYPGRTGPVGKGKIGPFGSGLSGSKAEGEPGGRLWRQGVPSSRRWNSRPRPS